MEELRQEHRAAPPPLASSGSAPPRLRAGDLLRRFPVTAALLALTFLIYGLEYLPEGQVTALLRLGAVRGDLVFERGELYRLICPIFLHAVSLHLAVNAFALLQLAALTEYVFGSRRLIVAYLGTGIAASLASALSRASPFPSVGASGALFGLAGLLLAVGAFGAGPARAELRRFTGRALPISVGLSFVAGVATALLWRPVIDNWAHLGGFMAGVALAPFWRRPDRRPGRVVSALAGGLVGLAAAALGWMALDGAGAARSFERDTVRLLRPELAAIEDPGTRLERLAEAALVLGYELGPHASVRATRALLDREELAALLARVDELEPLQQLATAMLLVGHPDADLPHERWLAVAPSDHVALNQLAWWLLVAGPVERRDPERALALSRRSLAELGSASTPSERLARAAYLDTQAEALLQLDRAAEALPLQREAVAIARVEGLRDLPELAARLRAIEDALGAAGG